MSRKESRAFSSRGKTHEMRIFNFCGLDRLRANLTKPERDDVTIETTYEMA